MEIRIYNQLEDMEFFAAQWDDLSLQSPQQNPIMSHAWLSCFFSVYGSQIKWFVVAAFDADRLMAVLPLTIQSRKTILGNVFFLQPPKNDHTLSVDAITISGSQSVLPLLHKAAFKYCPSAQYIEYSRIDAVSENYRWLASHQSLLVQTDMNAFGYSISSDSTYDSYYAQLSKNHRSNLNRWSNKLKQFSSSEVIFLDRNDENTFLGVFEMEHGGWKGREKSSVFSDDKSTQYFQSLAASLEKKGWLRYQILKGDDSYLAGNFSVRFNKTQLLWKLAYSDNHSKMSPGSLLLSEIIKDAFEKKEKIDLMTNESWYENWNMVKREFMDIQVFQLKPISLLLAVSVKMRMGLSRLKSWLRKLKKVRFK